MRCRYNKLDVLAVAHRRYGSAAGLRAAAQLAAAKSAKAKETRGRNVQQRRWGRGRTWRARRSWMGAGMVLLHAFAQPGLLDAALDLAL